MSLQVSDTDTDTYTPFLEVSMLPKCHILFDAIIINLDDTSSRLQVKTQNPVQALDEPIV